MNKTKIVRLLTVILLSILLLSSATVYAASTSNPPYGTYQSIQTPLFKQPSVDSCWAAAASMAANAMDLSLGDVTSTIMNYVGTNFPSHIGTIQGSLDGILKYRSSYSVGLYNPHIEDSYITPYGIMYQIGHMSPVCVRYLMNETSQTGMHEVVIQACSSTWLSSSNTYDLKNTTIWYNDSLNYGEHSAKYTDFYSNWKATIVLQ